MREFFTKRRPAREKRSNSVNLPMLETRLLIDCRQLSVPELRQKFTRQLVAVPFGRDRQ
jgi:hypothetical protein